MSVSVETVMRSINNYFETGYIQTTVHIENGVITPSTMLQIGEYIAICGSYYHNGVWKVGEGFTLTDCPADTPSETFTGRVWFLHPPASFLNLCDEISDFDTENPVGASRVESLGSYSYTKYGYTSEGAATGGGAQTWQGVFSLLLAPYRHMYTEVSI